MFAELRAFNERLASETPFEDWNEESRDRLKQAYSKVRNHVMKLAKIVITTSNAMGGPLIRQYFGQYATAVAVSKEEASMDIEPDTWQFLKWSNVNKVKALMCVGDILQLHPLVLSAHKSPQINGFARQLQLVLMARPLHQGFPSLQLTTQHRMHPDISAEPSRMTYQGKLKNASLHKTLALHRGFQDALRN